MIYKMRLRQKIFLSSFLVSIFLFAFCGLFVIVSGHKLNLKKEYADAGRRARHIAVQLQADAALVSPKDDMPLGDTLEVFFARYQSDAAYSRCAFKVMRGDEVLYDSFRKEAPELRYDFGYKIISGPIYVQSFEDDNYLFIETNVVLHKEVYNFVMVDDLNDIYAMCDAQLGTLLLLCIALSLLSALVMLIISFLITLPIKHLNKAVNTVASDVYSFRLPIEGNDEFCELAQSFNLMCDAIENNVSHYKHAIDNFTHEVKTPLTSIIGYAEMLQSNQCDEDIRSEAIGYILAQGRRLHTLTRKIMSFMIAESDKTEKKRILIGDALEMANRTLSMTSELRQVKIKSNVPHSTFLYGDPELIVALLMNLIENAIKASSAGMCVHIKAASVGGALSTLDISDTGIGISESEIPRVLDLFYVVDKSRSREQNGLGLGLSICSSIIRAHKAKLEIQSCIGTGTKIHIEFPYNEYLALEKDSSTLLKAEDS